MRRPLIFTGILFLLAAVLAVSAACGDDDPSASPTPDGSGEPTETSEGSDTTPTPASGDLAEVLTLVDTFLNNVDGKVVYDYTSNFGQHADGTYTTYYQEDLDRHDWLSRTGGFETPVVTLVTETTGYSCTLVPGFPTCQELPKDQVLERRAAYKIIPVTLTAISEQAAPMTAIRLPDEQIADAAAICYDVEIETRLIPGPLGSERLKLCFTEDGALLLMDHDVFFDDADVPQGELDFVAIAVGQATAEDFDPPADIVGS